MNPTLTNPSSTCLAATAVEVMVAAFQADPANRWLYPDEQQYRKHFPEFVRLLGGKAFECGTVDLAADDAAAALWLPPGVQPDEEALVSHVMATANESLQPAMSAMLEQMGALHPDEPHWYLPFIGVRPVYQGRGHGSQLLQLGLRRCDRDGLPAYLEATDPHNVRLYERHGFRVVGRIQAGDSPTIFPMLRAPRTAAGSDKP